MQVFQQLSFKDFVNSLEFLNPFWIFVNLTFEQRCP